MISSHIIVTGGAGYIGSHTCKALALSGFKPVTIDNLTMGHAQAVKWGPLEQVDVRDTEKMTNIFKQYQPRAVIHFAASAYVGESMNEPLKYYSNNISGTISTLQAAILSNVRYFIFSSSCSVYGIPSRTPINEETHTNPISPYGDTKQICERMLQWMECSKGLKWISLRYFNAAGADSEGETGEIHNPETHLIPLTLLSASGDGPMLNVFGDDFPTIDGTAIRDYVHVTDLANAHVIALKYLLSVGNSEVINLGTGKGHGVKEIIDSVKRVTGKSVPYKIVPRRHGDPPELWADVNKARRILDWKASYTELDDIIETAWAWYLKNSSGRNW